MNNNIIPFPKNVKIQSTKQNIEIEFFSDEDLTMIFDFIKNKIETDKKKSDYHRRYLLLCKTLLRTGARIDEALQLKPSDINLDLNTITLITLKKRKDSKRTIPLHPELKDHIMNYFLNFNISPRSQELIFSMKRQAVDLYFKKMQNQLNIRIHAHKFRHTFGVRAVLDHVPLSVLQEWLGHSSIFTTSIYTQITGMNTNMFMNQIH
ncbi:MAG: site-specific integrase [Thermoplasmata archaeon]